MMDNADLLIQTATYAVAVRGGRIIAAGEKLNITASKTLDYPKGILLPGLIDMHAHPAMQGSKHGVDPDACFLPQGVTTVLSQGDCGSDHWPQYLQHTIKHCRTRVRLAINLSAIGESTPHGALTNIDHVDIDRCIRAIEDGGEYIWGVSVNIDRHDTGPSDPREIIRRAVAVAKATGKPILFGMRTTQDLSFSEQLGELRPGDVVTYLFRTQPHCIIEAGQVHPAIWDAKKRGVLFDVGHGAGSFDFATAQAAIARGFCPDTISTDFHNGTKDQTPPHSLARTMSKLVAAGMSEKDVFTAVTATPAKLLGLSNEIGVLAPGTCADITVLRWSANREQLTDVNGQQVAGRCLETLLTLRAGRKE